MDDLVTEYLRSHYQKPFEKECADGNKEGADESGSETKKQVLIDAIAESTLDPSELRDGVLNVLIAGRDTTGAVLSNVFFMLARHPDVWDRVRAEVEETFEGRLPDFESLHNLKQVRYLLNECMYSPSFSLLNRSSLADNNLQLCVSSPHCPSTCGPQIPTPYCQREADPKEKTPSLLKRANR